MSNKPRALESSVKPYSATHLPTLPDTDEIKDGMKAMAVACNGATYLGIAIEAQILAVKLLRDRPDIARALGIDTNKEYTPQADPNAAAKKKPGVSR